MRRRLPSLKTRIATLPPVESNVLSRLSAIIAFFASTGQGKTHTCLGMLKLLKREKSITKLYILSPTYDSNPIFTSVVNPEVDYIYRGTKDFKKVLDWIEQDADAIAEEYKTKLAHQVALRKFTNGEAISMVDEDLIEKMGFVIETPQRPGMALVLDDLQGTNIYSNSRSNALNSLVLRSRHVGQGLGLSCFMLLQESIGLPSVLRKNCTGILVWGTQNKKEIESVYNLIGGLCTFEHFQSLLESYTSGSRHNYLFADLYRKEILPSF